MLHEVVQEAMGWEHAHLHELDIAGTRYGLPDPDWDTGVGDESRTKLFGLVAAGDRFSYIYDLGDSREHVLTIESITTPEPGVRYPRCIAGERACPPEDVGGLPGYEPFLDALGDPAHPDHADRVEWWGPDRFDPTDRALQRLAWTPLAAATT